MLIKETIISISFQYYHNLRWRKKKFLFEKNNYIKYNYEIKIKRRRKNLIELIIHDMFAAFGFYSTMEKSKHFIGLHSGSTKKTRTSLSSPPFLPSQFITLRFRSFRGIRGWLFRLPVSPLHVRAFIIKREWYNAGICKSFFSSCKMPLITDTDDVLLFFVNAYEFLKPRLYLKKKNISLHVFAARLFVC